MRIVGFYKTDKITMGKAVPAKTVRFFPIETVKKFVILKSFPLDMSNDSVDAAVLLKYMLGDNFWTELGKILPQDNRKEFFNTTVLKECLETCINDLIEQHPIFYKFKNDIPSCTIVKKFGIEPLKPEKVKELLLKINQISA